VWTFFRQSCIDYKYFQEFEQLQRWWSHFDDMHVNVPPNEIRTQDSSRLKGNQEWKSHQDRNEGLHV
jgi:hypothetical protein